MIFLRERHRSLLMHVRTRQFPLVGVLLVVSAHVTAAQSIPGWETKQFSMERLDAERVRLMREVEVIGVGPNKGQQIFADDLLWNTRTGELSAEGNVLVVSPTGRIAAERVVFNTKTGHGTFYTASGIASLGDRGEQDRSMFGTLEPDVYFYGEMIEKIGDDRYRITRGGFTTCVQPTPRWDIVSDKATIDLEDYAILRNAVLRVKDVPVFYLPVLYYPIQSDDRATGFLMPTYGQSTYRGRSISNAFFWAINRSQDLTLFHDWLFSRGQGYGSEYRYAVAPGSEGQLRLYRLNEKASTIDTSDGSAESNARRSMNLNGSIVQQLPGGFRGHARLDYFSNVTVQQLYQNNFYDASNSTRVLSGGVTGAWKSVSIGGNLIRSETFSNAENSYVTGNLPSLTATLSSRQIGTLPLYASIQSETSNVLQIYKNSGVIDDRGLWRTDFLPSLRAPISKLPYLTVNGTLAWRYTHFSERIENREQVPIGIHRDYFDMGVDTIGPVLTRVFAPNPSSARRLKHVIEPIFGFHRITAIPNRASLPVVGGTDNVYGGAGTINYGFNNRIIMRSPPRDQTAVQSAPRELVVVSLQQSYYTDRGASFYDPSYSFSYLNSVPKQFSPWTLTVRSSPIQSVTTDYRLEYDTQTRVNRLQGMALNGAVSSTHVQASGGWSLRRLGGFDPKAPLDNILQSSTTLKTASNTVGGTFTFYYDVRRSTLMQHRWIGYYNAQCCGLIVEYQVYSYPTGDPNYPVPKDRRFNLSFSLAGIGSFSNLLGAFGGGLGGRY
jgi:lipopolysaccharide assembly outer membrane protein LptD (OstA)